MTPNDTPSSSTAIAAALAGTAPADGQALFLAYLILPIMYHDEDIAETVKVIPMILSRN